MERRGTDRENLFNVITRLVYLRHKKKDKIIEYKVFYSCMIFKLYFPKIISTNNNLE